MKLKSIDGAKGKILPRPRSFNSDIVSNELSIQMRQSRKGDLFYHVQYSVDGEARNAYFQYFDSVLDFIASNFEG